MKWGSKKNTGETIKWDLCVDLEKETRTNSSNALISMHTSLLESLKQLVLLTKQFACNEMWSSWTSKVLSVGIFKKNLV